MPHYASRARLDEMMDDFTIVDARLHHALDQLRHVNRLLGGYRATMAVLAPFLRRHAGRTVRLLDVGTGVADFPEYVVGWAARRGLDVRVEGLDANAETVAYAAAVLDRRLAPPLRARVSMAKGDALALPYADGAFDAAMCSLFLHHFDDAAAVRVLREMDRVSRYGVVVNDLHRHPLAYRSIQAIVSLLPVSPMFRHDGPVSVLRAFRRSELEALAREAGLGRAEVRWCWAFRWVVSTLRAGAPHAAEAAGQRPGAHAV